ncbi:transporter substrate-binding domain-containing protein [Trinickia acidisoli]|uniref:transporter substrate-binding domain-containing protein n=1 Tax=Trinickia acidisoli TaxID=2767482 RepID=UPI001A8CBDE8|nr:transporter substrate-binding domain-containing protein [Trinickia acidisoli]
MNDAPISTLAARTVEETGIAVGVLFAQSGHMAVTEEAMLRGTLIAIDEINGAGGIEGRMLIPYIESPLDDHINYRDLATKLIVHDHVSAIFGCCSSASRKAVLPVVERHDTLLFYPSVYEGFEYSPNVIYSGPTPSQSVVPLLEYLFSTCGRKVFLIGSNYVFAREINRITREFLEESEAIVAGELYLDFSPSAAQLRVAVEQVAKARADLILSTVVGEDTAALLNACNAHGIRASSTPVATLTAGEGELARAVPRAREGVLTANPYFPAIDTPENRAFVERYQQRYGLAEWPSMYAASAYSQVHLFALGVRQAGATDTGAVLAALQGARLGTPHGEIVVDAENNHVSLQPRIGRARPDGSFEIIWEAQSAVQPDPYLVSYNRHVR